MSFLDENDPSWRASLDADMTKAIRGDGKASALDRPIVFRTRDAGCVESAYMCVHGCVCGFLDGRQESSDAEFSLLNHITMVKDRTNVKTQYGVCV